MNKPKRNSDAKLITVPMAMERYNLCRGNVMSLSREAGALIKYGRCVRIDNMFCGCLLHNKSNEFVVIDTT